MDIHSSNCVIIFLVFCLFEVTFQLNLESININSDVPVQPFCYIPSVLRSLRPANHDAFPPAVRLPSEVTKLRKRGQKGGVRNTLKKKTNRLPLTIVITGNSQSLNNKTDELSACVKHCSEYKQSSLIAISETWFKNNSIGTKIDNFELVRGDRTEAARKDGGGGVCLYVTTDTVILTMYKKQDTCVHPMLRY